MTDHAPRLKPCKGGRWRIYCTCDGLREPRRYTTQEAALRRHIEHVEDESGHER